MDHAVHPVKHLVVDGRIFEIAHDGSSYAGAPRSSIGLRCLILISLPEWIAIQADNLELVRPGHRHGSYHQNGSGWHIGPLRSCAAGFRFHVVDES